jgi:hypothetical protein
MSSSTDRSWLPQRRQAPAKKELREADAADMALEPLFPTPARASRAGRGRYHNALPRGDICSLRFG